MLKEETESLKRAVLVEQAKLDEKESEMNKLRGQLSTMKSYQSSEVEMAQNSMQKLQKALNELSANQWEKSAVEQELEEAKVQPSLPSTSPISD